MILLCRLGLHRWVYLYDGGHSPSIVCTRCGRGDRPESRPTARRFR